MPWSSGFESQRQNLTSLLGTLATLSEGKKNRRAQFLSDILGMGAQFGGAALQNKWGKEAASTAYGRQQEMATTEFERGLTGKGFSSPEEVVASRKSAEELEKEKLELEKMKAMLPPDSLRLITGIAGQTGRSVNDVWKEYIAQGGSGEGEDITYYAIARTVYQRELAAQRIDFDPRTRTPEQTNMLIEAMAQEAKDKKLDENYMRQFAAKYLQNQAAAGAKPGGGGAGGAGSGKDYARDILPALEYLKTLSPNKEGEISYDRAVLQEYEKRKLGEVNKSLENIRNMMLAEYRNLGGPGMQTAGAPVRPMSGVAVPVSMSLWELLEAIKKLKQ